MLGLFFIGIPFTILVMYILIKVREHDNGWTIRRFKETFLY
jgi:hypothetical protein